MVKRKRNETSKEDLLTEVSSKAAKATPTDPEAQGAALTLQIVTGSYERVLHGFTATIPPTKLKSDTSDESTASTSVQCADTFLFEAHGSAIRCLALSPLPKASDSGEAQKVILASGSTDERINLYSVSAAPPAVNDNYPSVATLAGNKVLENPKNRELGSLLHHSASITALSFPSRSKLLAAAEDNTISVTKTRDWTVVSTIKAPHPKVQGRPSGDTAPPGATPSGINQFAVHPSMKLMLSVGKGEKCMRLWNLVTGKKAGVLNFGREVLQSVKEGKWSTGEGRRIAWGSEGEEFAVAFEWGVVVFGIDSTPKCRLVPSPQSKLHQMKYISIPLENEQNNELLVLSTEDGRVVFYSTKTLQEAGGEDESQIPCATAVAQLGGRQAGLPGRIKDFEILSLEGQATEFQNNILVITGNSEGAVRIWTVGKKDLTLEEQSTEKKDAARQTGKLLTTNETGNRITCLASFVMLPSEDPATLLDSDEEEEEEEEEEEQDDEDDSSS